MLVLIRVFREKLGNREMRVCFSWRKGAIYIKISEENVYKPRWRSASSSISQIFIYAIKLSTLC